MASGVIAQASSAADHGPLVGAGVAPASAISAKPTTNNVPGQQHKPPVSGPDPSSPLTDQDHFHHTHRQNHNSSKLPAFRFADLNKSSFAALSTIQIRLPSPVSPTLDPPEEYDLKHGQPNGHLGSPTPPPTAGTSPGSPTLDSHQQPLQPALRPLKHTNNPILDEILDENSARIKSEQSAPPNIDPAADQENLAALKLDSPDSTPARQGAARSRASTFQTPSTSVPESPSATFKRSASLDSPSAAAKVQKPVDPNALKSPTDSATTIVATPPQRRFATASSSSLSFDDDPELQQPLSTQHLRAAESVQDSPQPDDITKEWAQGQRELLLPKTVQRAGLDDKRASGARRPPVSYRPPAAHNPAGGSTAIPPIRSFRSSGSRRSLVLDMNVRSRGYSSDESDSNHLDRTLRALEGRRDEDSQITPPDSALERPDNDDSGDIFLKMSRDDPSRRHADENGSYAETQSTVTRLARSTHRRPLSAAVPPSFQAMSPPQITRRMSDQQDNTRVRGLGDDQITERVARSLTNRNSVRATPDDSRSKVSSNPLRTSPWTPRALTFQDTSSDVGSAYGRRRTSLSEAGSALPARMSSLKQPYGQSRSYNSSPLAPKAADSLRHDHHSEAHHGPEGTESTASTAAPSTMWDELDELKSRIHRLELTGKLPSTSGGAVSRASDDRPPTATTNATSMSTSPKRGSGSAAQSADLGSTTSSHKEVHPLLFTALSKSKQFVGTEVYTALETAANDALALSSMMGIAGQPGPVSSGASTVGGLGGVTDRQLRRKADSICRSLTELCLALSEGAIQKKTPQNSVPLPEPEPLVSPTKTRFTSMTAQRRASAANAPDLPSPRALSRLEEKRNSMMLSSALPSPARYAAATPTGPAAPSEMGTPGRKSSLLVARSRRAGTEEPDEGRKSSLLRTRRAGTEEPDEGRKSSLLIRSRREPVENHEEDETRFRTPSRAVTEAVTPRAATREYVSHVPQPVATETSPGIPVLSSALPRRRLVSSALTSKLVQPSTQPGSATRRYLDRSTPDRDSQNTVMSPSEERGTRQFSLSQNLRDRAGSLTKRLNRESMMTTTSTTAQAGGLR